MNKKYMLENCPCCNECDSDIRKTLCDESYYIYCHNCGYESESKQTVEEAIEEWNHVAKEYQQHEQKETKITAYIFFFLTLYLILLHFICRWYFHVGV